jgi:iron(III) transport system permease protein
MSAGTGLARIRPARTGIVLLTAGLLLALAAAPLLELARIASGGGWRRTFDVLASGPGLAAVRNTLTVGVVVTMLAVALGTAAALAVEGRPARERRVLRLAVAAPLLIPEFVLGFSWSAAYGPAGYTDHYLHLRVPGLLGPAGIISALMVHALPLAYLTTAAGLAVRPITQLQQAARACGAGPAAVLRTVTLPLLRAPMLAAAALVFVSCVNSFAIPQVLGTPDGFATMSTLVYNDLNLSADPDSFRQLAAVALAMAALVFVVVGAAEMLLGGQARALPGNAAAAPGGQSPPRVALAVRLLVAVYTLLATVAPLLALIAGAVTRGPGLSPTPSHWTLANFHAALSGQTIPALIRSLILAAAAAILIPAMGLAVTATGTRSRRALGTAVTLAYAIPGSALAVGVLIAYGRWLTGSALIILIAYLGKLWAIGHRPIAAAAERLDPAPVWAARASGAGALRAWRDTTLPALRPALLTGGALTLIFATHELTMSSILYGPGTQTLAVVLLDQQQLGQVGATSALALLLSVPPLSIGLMLARGRRRPRPVEARDTARDTARAAIVTGSPGATRVATTVTTDPDAPGSVA